MRIIVINLDKDVDRLAFMAAQLKKNDLQFERFRGVTPDSFTPQQKAFAESPARSAMGKGEIACALSHIEVWREVVSLKSSMTLILEDDVHLAPDFGQFFRSVQFNDDETCIHRFETFLARVTMERKPVFKAGGRAARELLTNHGGSAAYAINHRTAEELLSLADGFRNGVDIELFDPSRGFARHIPTYQWLPAPCIQDMLIQSARSQGFSSNMSQRADDHLLAGAEHAAIKLARNLLRPANTFVRDAMLRPFGRMRSRIHFG